MYLRLLNSSQAYDPGPLFCVKIAKKIYKLKRKTVDRPKREKIAFVLCHFESLQFLTTFEVIIMFNRIFKKMLYLKTPLRFGRKAKCDIFSTLD